MSLVAFAFAATMAQVASAFLAAGGLYHCAATLGGRGWATAWFNLVGLVALNVATLLPFLPFAASPACRGGGVVPAVVEAESGWGVPGVPRRPTSPTRSEGGRGDMSIVRRSAMGLVAVWLACVAPARALEFHELDTDRDAFTPATTTAKLGTVVTEASYVWIDNRDTPATNSFPELLVRFGTRERFEWRFGFNYEQNSGGSVVAAVEVGEPPAGEAGADEANLLYGFKVRLTDQEGFVPRSAAIVEAFTPVAGDVWGTEPAITYAFGWELATGWRFDTAIRYARAESEAVWFDRWMPSVVLRIPVTERWEVHAEWFGEWSQGLEDDAVRGFLGPGTHYMITPRLELGCRMGWGLTRDAAGTFVDSGIGWRF